jgi:hypothetical protein
MQKVINILEQHVQWIAIGLGALFVLFMTYSYVLTPPAQVLIAQTTLSPGQVDEYTVDHVVKPLEAEITRNARIDIPVPQYVQAFKDAMVWKDPASVSLAGGWHAPTQDIKIIAPTTPVTPGGEVPIVTNKVKALPIIPKPVWQDFKVGRSLILPPVIGVDGIPVAQPAPQPGQPGAEGVDKDWITQLYKIPMDQLADAFTKAGLPVDPAVLHQTVFLQVELVREEQDSAGRWVNQQVIRPIPVWRSNQPPPPFPPDGVNREMQGQYLGWATANAPDILQPLFYQTIPGKGDQWMKPGQQAGVTLTFDPSTFKGDISTLPPNEKKAVLDYKREQTRLRLEQDKAKRPAPAPRAPAGGGRSAPGGGPPEFAPAPPNYAPAPPPRALPRQPVRSLPPEMVDPAMRGEDGSAYPGYNPGNQAQPGQPPLPIAGTDYPNGEFDPVQWKDKPVEAWAHDDTVKAGKTYRYRMRYKVKNPIFAAGNVADPETLSDQFALSSDFSDWTQPTTIPSLVNFFVASSKPPDGNTIRFDVFRWDAGQQKMESFTVSPGDQIGGQRNGTDYTTTWTVVDFRDDPRADTQILLVNNIDGSVVVRSFKADQQDALYKGLKAQLMQLKAAENATAGAGGAAAPAVR